MADTSYHIDLMLSAEAQDVLYDADRQADCTVFSDLADASELELEPEHARDSYFRYHLDAVISATGMAEIERLAGRDGEVEELCLSLQQEASPMEDAEFVSEINHETGESRQRHAYPTDFDPLDEATDVDDIGPQAAERVDGALQNFVEEFSESP